MIYIVTSNTLLNLPYLFGLHNTFITLTEHLMVKFNTIYDQGNLSVDKPLLRILRHILVIQFGIYMNLQWRIQHFVRGRGAEVYQMHKSQ